LEHAALWHQRPASASATPWRRQVDRTSTVKVAAGARIDIPLHHVTRPTSVAISTRSSSACRRARPDELAFIVAARSARPQCKGRGLTVAEIKLGTSAMSDPLSERCGVWTPTSMASTVATSRRQRRLQLSACAVAAAGRRLAEHGTTSSAIRGPRRRRLGAQPVGRTHADPCRRDKVHLKVAFSASRDGSLLGRFETIYIVTLQAGHWVSRHALLLLRRGARSWSGRVFNVCGGDFMLTVIVCSAAPLRWLLCFSLRRERTGADQDRRDEQYKVFSGLPRSHKKGMELAVDEVNAAAACSAARSRS